MDFKCFRIVFPIFQLLFLVVVVVILLLPRLFRLFRILKLAKDIQDTVPDSEVKSAAPRRTFEDAENVQLHLDLCESHC